MKYQEKTITHAGDMSHPAWGARIEMSGTIVKRSSFTSHPAWGARIEISRRRCGYSDESVAPRMGCAD